ncbi:sensor histidine kinase [Arenicella xantha]|uniref:histidine kinase n=1 Tax=Arenicella xantha TaxID=644221 RepID=A0A395JMR7_9GAMM|nr:ATP-binding protein [Arenicella xantha]RBP50894.1 signal transduction histidine kinase [Arenicella xantha]
MNDLTLISTAEAKKRGLNRRFVAAGLTTILLIVAVLTAGGYARLQKSATTDMANRVSSELQRIAQSNAVTEVMKNAAVTPNDTNMDSSKIDPLELERHLARLIGNKALSISGVESIALFDINGGSVWRSRADLSIADEQRVEFTKLLQSRSEPYRKLNHNLLEASSWLEALSNNYPISELLVSIRLPNKRVEVAKLNVDFRDGLSAARLLAGQLLLVLVISTSLLFLLLFYTFRRGIQTINEQEDRLSEQITRLSKLLTSNKDMQRSMKTASARAVELNEQFLRRVGADLHDGPAQMIGFAVMRLAQVSKQEAATQFGHEFHAVRQALDESLEEIRGISSGLVLPELEKMSLEECLRKVVLLHGTKSDSDIAQFYQDLPDDIPLPIKITAYRFTQEGLNNSHRHGQAKKCRLNAFVKGDVLHLSLKDNGVGFRKSTLSPSGGHLGLMGLKDRIESLGGKFSINSELGVGTALKLSISLKDDN